jgi:hypothetical protein
MAGPTRIQRVLSVLVSLPLLSPCAGAWSNGGYSADQSNPDYGTHDWIAEAALAMQTRDVTFLRTTYHSEFLLGTEAPDNPHYIGDTTKHHVYFYASHQLQDDICAVRASQIYETALDYMLAGDNHSAAFDIGVMAHYISDPGVFGHTMGAYTDWGTETHHSDYENEFESMIGSLSPPTGLSLGDSDAYNATLGLGESITFGEGAIQSNVWMDTHYNWADGTFEASAMASLNGAVSAVAAVINHLMIDASSSSPPPPPPSPQPPPEVPLPPLALTASVEGSHVILTWSPPSSDGGASITDYVIYRGTDPENPSYLAIVSSSSHGWTDDSPERGKTYYYWVAAENSVGLSDLSEVTSATAPKKPSSLMLPVVMSAISLAAASGGIFLWRRRTRGAPLP